MKKGGSNATKFDEIVESANSVYYKATEDLGTPMSPHKEVHIHNDAKRKRDWKDESANLGATRQIFQSNVRDDIKILEHVGRPFRSRKSF